MNYEKIYNALIDSAKNKQVTEYFENHHIIPKSLGGSDDESNLVKLTYREHYLAHWLLFKLTKDVEFKFKMGCAFFLMSKSNNGKRISNSKYYERARKAFILSLSNFNKSDNGILIRKNAAKKRLDKQKLKFTYHFYHENYGDFNISTVDLVEIFKEHNLNSANLVKVGKEIRPSHKGWILFKNKEIGISGFLENKKKLMSLSAKKKYDEGRCIIDREHLSKQNAGRIVLYSPTCDIKRQVKLNSDEFNLLISQGYWSKLGYGIEPENIKIDKLYTGGYVALYSNCGSIKTYVDPQTDRYNELISRGYWSKNGKHGKKLCV